MLLLETKFALTFVDTRSSVMVKVVEQLGTDEELGLKVYPLAWALALGACLGGNGALIGASGALWIVSGHFVQ